MLAKLLWKKMLNFKRNFLGLFLILMSISSTLLSNPLDPERMSYISVHDHYSAMMKHYKNKDWKRLGYRSLDLIADFPESAFIKEAYYYLGLAYFEQQDYELSNINFSAYLKEDLTPKFFDQVIRYKFEIACKFQEGSRRHLMSSRKMPKWLKAYDIAVEIFDEVITTLPRDDLAAQSLFRKGNLLLEMKEYKTSVEAYQTLIRRFPKHELAPQCYLGISNVYLWQCKDEFPDEDRLALAEINLRKFISQFPRSPLVEQIKVKIFTIKELLAKNLFDIGEFYKRVKKAKAAAIYYETIIKRFPETSFSERSRKRLLTMDIPKKQTSPKEKDAHHNQLTAKGEEVSALPAPQ